MNTENNTNEEQDSEILALELQSLKDRGTQLGLTFHPNIGAKMLAERIREKIALIAAEEALVQAQAEEARQAANQYMAPPPLLASEIVSPKRNNEAQLRLAAKEKALALVRVQITCLNPQKTQYTGDIYCAGNSVVGTVKRFIQYGSPWHVERIILNMLREKKYQAFVTRTLPDGSEEKKGKLVDAYAIQELPYLTDNERRELANRQVMSNQIDQE
jgi:hypothetical protein